jgi:hypothetical protein
LAKEVKDVPALVGCDVKGDAASDCVRAFIERFGQRAYRRPLTADEAKSLLDIWTTTTAAADAEMGVRGVLTAILVSPHFLFRPEFGDGASSVAGALKASPFEIASRLASLLWSSIPDDDLLEAAAKGELQTRAQVSAQAQRLLEDPRARAATSSFYEQWLDLARLSTASKDAKLYPEFDAALKTSMAEEAKRFVDFVVWEGDARAATLFGASFSFLNKRMAKHYGVEGPADDATFERVELDPSKFAGFLTQPAYMAGLASPTESSPFKRGAWVRRRLLCQDLPDPPNDVPNLPKPKEGLSLRERAEQHSAGAACRGCHQLIDGLGFGLEQYDAIGGFRDVEGGEPIDSSGVVTSTEDADGEFNGGAELAARLAGSEQVRRCVATQWLRYSLARPDSADDACALAQLQTSFQESDGDLKGLMLELTQTDAFSTYRAPKEAP